MKLQIIWQILRSDLYFLQYIIISFSQDSNWILSPESWLVEQSTRGFAAFVSSASSTHLATPSHSRLVNLAFLQSKSFFVYSLYWPPPKGFHLRLVNLAFVQSKSFFVDSLYWPPPQGFHTRLVNLAFLQSKSFCGHWPPYREINSSWSIWPSYRVSLSVFIGLLTEKFIRADQSGLLTE